MQQQDSDAEDQQPQSLLPDSENGEVQQPIDDSRASDHGSQRSSRLIEEYEDSEDHYDQEYEESHDVAPDQEPKDAQDYLETLPSASERAAYPGPIKDIGNVRLIVAKGDEEGTSNGEEGKGIHACVCVHMFVHLGVA